MNKDIRGSEITTPILKLFIGFVAGLCAALFPRLTAALATQGDNLIFFPLSYVSLALVFAMLIGVVVMILEWGVRAKPSETFMMALGIPALLTGALNATLDTNTVKNLAQQKERLTQELSQQAEIPILPARPVSPINSQSSLQLKRDSFLLTLWEVRPVYAQSSTYAGQQQGFNPGIQIQQRPYLIVIDRAVTQEQAIEKAKRWRTQLPQVEVVRADRDFLVVQGGGPRTKSEALFEAIRLKKEYNLSPSLLEVGPISK